jgi:hypothetical protein
MSQAISRTPINSQPRLNKYGYNCIARHVSLVFFVCAPLFIGAGTLRWDWACIFTVVTLVGWITMSLILARINPQLLNERGKRMKALTGTKRWDWMIMGVYSVLLLATPLVEFANIGWHQDHRYRCTRF